MADLLSGQFVITGSRQGAAATVELHGELDLAMAPRLVAEFHRLLASDPAVVIVDLRDLSFMDARGMRALIDLRTSCHHQGRRFVLVRGQRRVHRMLVLCNFAQAFEFVDSAAEALELTGAADGSLDGTDTGFRSRSALDFADHRRPTGAPIGEVANRAMRARQGPIAESEPFARRQYRRDRTALEQLLARRISRRSSVLG